MDSMELKMKLHRKLLLICLLSSFITAPLFAAATDSQSQQIEQLQKQMRAVQRKVFSDGKNHEIVSPEITAPAAPAQPQQTETTNLTTELSARIDSLEQSMTQLTAQSEENSHRLRQMEQQFENFKTEVQSRLTAPAEAGVTGDTDPVNMPPQAAASTKPTAEALPPRNADTASNLSKAPKAIATKEAPIEKAVPAKAAVVADKKAPPAIAAAAPVASKAAPEKVAATAPKSVAGLISENAEPNSDPAEQVYSAGYKLWNDKRYPEAETVLKSFIAKYPSHPRASYARNLLGRSYLDAGEPAQAAEIFYSNYQSIPQGARAPDSLYFLGQSLMTLKPARPKDACKVYAELLDVYSDKINDSLKDRIGKAQTQAKCR
ncbi:MAG: tetratricopeptide repeat protein [Zymomonas mobilis]|uniref:Tetratricopeptide repeat protein n=1 Tax=Zymomonas mobilis TaxID=542 RepID=A0A542W319_ZYMMB|nr:tetratricopeptide repeat protein [Zymomonas mobilis]TQL17960.1 tetratricopeptide repeat protein [Zymomonas mobilis]